MTTYNIIFQHVYKTDLWSKLKIKARLMHSIAGVRANKFGGEAKVYG